MYVERKGYVIMKGQPMQFLSGQDEETDNYYFEDDIEFAVVFDTIEEAKDMVNELPMDDYEILNYEKTIFICKAEEKECSCCGECDKKENTELSDIYKGIWNPNKYKYEGTE